MAKEPESGPLGADGRPLRGAARMAWERRQSGATGPAPRSSAKSKGEPPLVEAGHPRLPWEQPDAKKRMAETEALLKSMGITPERAAESYAGMHALLAGMMREPAMMITREESVMVGEQLYRVIVLYDLVWLLKYMPIFMLATSVGIVETNTVRRVRAARAERQVLRRPREPEPGPLQEEPQEEAPDVPSDHNGRATAEAMRDLLQTPGVDATGEVPQEI